MISVEIPEHNTLFAALFQSYNPEKINEIVPQHILLYRKEISEAIEKENPYDLESRSIYESAGYGFLAKVSTEIDHAKAWIFSENELSPEYISWIPDVIGANLVVNGLEYSTSLPCSNHIYLDYEPKLNVYTLKQ
jgi:hypothetical protein